MVIKFKVNVLLLGCWMIATVATINDCMKSRAAVGVDDLSKLKQLWAIQQNWDSTTKSLEIDGYKFAGGLRSPDNIFTREELERLVYQRLLPILKTSDGSPSINSLREIMLPIFYEVNDLEKPNRPLGHWRAFNYSEDSGRIRVNDLFGNQGGSETVVLNGERDRYLHGFRQANVHMHMDSQTVEDIEFFISMPYGEQRKNTWSVTRLDNGMYRADSLPLTIDFDVDTGFRTRYSTKFPDGKYRFERIQVLPAGRNSLSIPIPRLIVDAYYFPKSSHVRLLKAYVINRVLVNHEVDQHAFKLSVPAGTNIINNSVVDEEKSLLAGKERHLSGVVRDPVKDIRNFVDTGNLELRPVRPLNASGSSVTRLTLLVLNVIAIFAIVLYLIKKRWASSV